MMTAAAKRTPYTYNAIVERIVDGDTVVMNVDLGFGAWLHSLSFRLLGLNAREHDEAGGPQARDNLELLLPEGSSVTLTSVKADKYGGRYDAIVELPDGRDLCRLLIETDWAAVWAGAGHKPLPPWPRPE